MSLSVAAPMLLSTAFALGGMLVLRPLLHRARAFRLLTLAWAIVTIRILVPTGIELSIPSFRAIQPTPASIRSSPVLPATTIGLPPRSPQLPTVAAASNPVAASKSLVPVVLVWLWATGTALILGAQLRSHLVLRRRLHQATPSTDPRLQSILSVLAHQLGFRRPVRLRLSSGLPSPAICGLWQPCLLFPSDQIERLNDTELRHIVLHELAHWRHGDLHVQHLLRIACAVHWFNPLAWLALRAFRQDCELASDHFVIRHTSPAETSAYGATLLKLLGWVRGQTTSTAPALGVVDSSHHLKQRLLMLLHPRSCSFLRSITTTALLAMVLLISTLRPSFASGSSQVTTKAPAGWWENGNQTDAYTVGVDPTVKHRLPHSAYVKSDRDLEGKFGGMMQNIDATHYLGKRVRLSAALKTSRAGKGANLWLRIDGPVRGKSLAFDNMSDRPVTGSSDWTECAIVLDVPMDATNIAYGFFISNTGQAWVNDLQFEIVGPDVPLTVGPPAKPTRPTEPVNLSFTP